MPDEVLSLWLDPIEKEYGWPFRSIQDSTEGTKWKCVLCKKPLSFWASAEWRKEEVNFIDARFSQATFLSLFSIIDQALGSDTLVAGVSRTKERFGACARFVKENGNIPNRVVLFRDSEEFMHIVDGNHRLAAVSFLIMKNPPQSLLLPSWVVTEGIEPE